MQLHSQGSITPAQRAPRPIDPGTRIGHVHLRTADIDRTRAFYVDVLGFDVVFEARGVPGWGTTGDILFVSAGGYHHHLGFNTWKSAGGPPQPDGVTGLHHVATTARTWPSTSATPTATTSSSPGTGRSTSGRATSRATCRWRWTTSSTSTR
jgi:catechol-2,3-dioxygenase